MFTLQQIKDAHSKVKSGADFPRYIQYLKAQGVVSYHTYVTNGHSRFNGTDNFHLSSGTKYDALTIALTGDNHALKDALAIHQQGETDYQTFCRQAAEAGVENWIVDMNEMTCTYYNRQGGEMIKELIPLPPQPRFNKATISTRHQGEAFMAFGSSLAFKITSDQTQNQFGIYAIEMEPRAKGPKLHYHQEMDETFIINEGTLTVLTEEGETNVGAGSVVYIPKMTPHGYNNDSNEKINMTMLFNPGKDREEFFRELFRGIEQHPDDLPFFQDLYTRHDSYPVDIQNMIPMVSNRS